MDPVYKFEILKQLYAFLVETFENHYFNYTIKINGEQCSLNNKASNINR